MREKEVEKTATLARLEFSEEEKINFPEQLTKILDYIDQLKELDTTRVVPLGQPMIDKLEMAEDVIKEFKDTEKLTKIAPDFKNGFFRVKKVIE